MSSRTSLRWGTAAGAIALVLTMGTGAAGAVTEQIGPGRVEALGATSDYNGNVVHDTKTAKLIFSDGSSITATYAPAESHVDAKLMSSAPGATESDPPSVSVMNPNDWWGDSSTTGEYTPASVADADGLIIVDEAKSTCAIAADTQTTCADMGKFMFEFSRPTQDAVLHFSNICFNVETFAGSHAYRINTGESEFTSAGITFERISGTPGLESTSTRIGAPANPSATYDLNYCGYGSVRVLGTYTKIVLDVDVDYYVPSSVLDGTTQADLLPDIEDWSAITWSVFPGGLPETGSNPTLLVAALVTLIAGGFVHLAARRTA